MATIQSKCTRCRRGFEGDNDLDNFDNVMFCSGECSFTDWTMVSKVPIAYLRTDPARIPNQAGLKLALTWADQRDGTGLVIHGEGCGTGKTRTATLAYREFGIRSWYGREDHDSYLDDNGNHLGFWRSASDLKAEYLAVCRKSEERAAWFKRICDARILLLDDVDKISASDGMMETLFGILDTRLHNNSATIVTTNKTGDELIEKFGDEFGPPIVRRLRDLCLCLNFDAKESSALIIPMHSMRANA